MNIPIQTLNNIISQVLKEQDLSLMTNFRKNELLKKLLLYVEYSAKYYSLVKTHIDSVHGKIAPPDLYKNIADFLKTIVATPEFIQLNETVKSLAAKDIPEYRRVIPILMNSLSELHKYSVSFATPSKDAKGNIITVDQIYNSFHQNIGLFYKSLSSILVKLRSQYTESPTSNIDTKTATPSLEVASLMGDLGKVIDLYISEIEIVFRKFDSIRIESGEYSKKWEEYNILRGFNFHRQGLEVENDPKFANFSPQIRKKVADYFRNRPHPNMELTSAQTDYRFNMSTFINILLTGKYKVSNDVKTNRDLFPTEVYPTKEIQKAESINNSLQKIFGWSKGGISKHSLEGLIGEKLKILHSKMWDPTKQVYSNSEELKQLMQILYNIRRLYKFSLNKVVSNIQKFQKEEMKKALDANGPTLDAMIKYAQFAKLNARNVYLKLISNSGVEIDVAKYQELFSKQEDPVIAKRLAYWALFQRLGWTKGLKSEEAPDWLYGQNENVDMSTISPAPGSAPGPGITPKRAKHRFANVGPKKAPPAAPVPPTPTPTNP